MTTYKTSNMMDLINDFSLEYIKHDGKLWISVSSFCEKVILDSKFNSLVDVHDEDYMYNASAEYVRAKKCFEIAEKLKTHPEHYNVHQRLGLEVKFRKTDEIQTLEIIYDHYRGEYNMHYQHPELRYKMDTVIVMELSRSGGLSIEINEKGHSGYDEYSHEN